MSVFDGLRRWSLRLTAVSAFLLLAVVGYRILVFCPLVSLQRIEVKTQGHLDRQEILQWARLTPGGSLIKVDLDGIQRSIEAHPWVEQAWVERAFPHTLRITVRERRPVAKVVLDSGTFLVDGSGTLFASWDPAIPGQWVPLVGLRRLDLEQHPEECHRLLRAALELLGLCQPRLRMEILEVGLNPDWGLRLALRGGPSEVRLGFGELNERLGRLERILRHLGNEGRIQDAQWIDLRIPRRATVKFHS